MERTRKVEEPVDPYQEAVLSHKGTDKEFEAECAGKCLNQIDKFIENHKRMVKHRLRPNFDEEWVRAWMVPKQLLADFIGYKIPDPELEYESTGSDLIDEMYQDFVEEGLEEKKNEESEQG